MYEKSLKNNKKSTVVSTNQQHAFLILIARQISTNLRPFIFELKMRRYMSLEKTLYAYFALGPSSQPVVVGKPDERLLN